MNKKHCFILLSLCLPGLLSACLEDVKKQPAAGTGGAQGSFDPSHPNPGTAAATQPDNAGTNTDKSNNNDSPNGDSEGDGSLSKCEDGDIEECAMSEDGEVIDFPGGVIRPPCAVGERECEDGEWGACEGAIGPKAMDSCEPGNDDNCNGLPNDHCTCSAGKTQECGSNIGMCKKGTMTCQSDGTWGQDCEGEVAPVAEICDGRGEDEDCDGKADLDDEDCQCLGSGWVDCKVSGKFGDCSLGKSKCLDGKLGPCAPRFSPVDEFCGKRELETPGLLPPSGDEDCDNKIDESDEDNEFKPINGKKYMLDADGDGWGALPGPDSTRFYCKGAKVPASYVTFDASRQKDCGDCPAREKGSMFPSGAFVYPNNTHPIFTPSSCLRQVKWPGGDFDANCDNKIDKYTMTKSEGNFGSPPLPISSEELFKCSRAGSECVGNTGWEKPVICGTENRRFPSAWCWEAPGGSCQPKNEGIGGGSGGSPLDRPGPYEEIGCI